MSFGPGAIIATISFALSPSPGEPPGSSPRVLLRRLLPAPPLSARRSPLDRPSSSWRHSLGSTKAAAPCAGTDIALPDAIGPASEVLGPQQPAGMSPQRVGHPPALDQRTASRG